MSETRKKYFWRLTGRILVLIICTIVCFTVPEWFEILKGLNFSAAFPLSICCG